MPHRSTFYLNHAHITAWTNRQNQTFGWRRCKCGRWNALTFHCHPSTKQRWDWSVHHACLKRAESEFFVDWYVDLIDVFGSVLGGHGVILSLAIRWTQRKGFHSVSQDSSGSEMTKSQKMQPQGHRYDAKHETASNGRCKWKTVKPCMSLQWKLLKSALTGSQKHAGVDRNYSSHGRNSFEGKCHIMHYVWNRKWRHSFLLPCVCRSSIWRVTS